MYRDFLSEANLYRPHEALQEAYILYSEVAEIYRLVVEDLQKGEAANLDRALAGIFDLEKKAAEILAKL